MTTDTATIAVSVHLRGDDPFRTEFSNCNREVGPFATVRVAGHNLAAGVDLFVISPEQADSLIRAAVVAKDLLLAARRRAEVTP